MDMIIAWGYCLLIIPVYPSRENIIVFYQQ